MITNHATPLLPLLLLLTLPAVVQAQFTFTTNNGGITITGYTSANSAVRIPDETNGWPVTSIGDRAFYNDTWVTQLTIGTNVTTIGSYAFFSANILNLTIPNSVRWIGDFAFSGCPLHSLTIPNSVTNLGSYAFAGNLLTSVTLPESITSIPEYLFGQCTWLTNVTIPESVTSIGPYAFYDCYKMRSIRLPNSVTNIGSWAFAVCSSLTSIVIPRSVAHIGQYAFSYCAGLKGVYFKGDAPAVDPPLFGADIVTVYYLPGTMGWDQFANDNGLPVVLWNPAIQTADTTFGLRSNQFGFNITGTTNIPILVEASPALTGVSWVTLQACTLTNGSVYFSDPQWTNYPSRLYRVRSL
jgi:hypothetical protein